MTVALEIMIGTFVVMTSLSMIGVFVGVMLSKHKERKFMALFNDDAKTFSKKSE